MKGLIVIFLLLSFSSWAQLSQEGKDSANYALELLNNRENLVEADRIFMKYKDSAQADTSKIKLFIGVAFAKASLYRQNEAIEYAKKALVLSQDNDLYAYNQIIQLLGEIHFIEEDFDMTVFYLRQLIGKHTMISRELTNYENIINSFVLLDERDSVISYSQYVINDYAVNNELDRESREVLLRTRISKENYLNDSTNNSLELLKEGIEQKLLKDNANNNLKIGALYRRRENYDSALVFFKKSLRIANEQNDTIDMFRACNVLVGYYEEIEDESAKNKVIVLMHNYRNYFINTDQKKYRELLNLLDKQEKGSYNYVLWFVLFLGIAGGAVSIRYMLKNKKSKEIQESKVEIQKSISNSVKEKIELGLKEIENNQEYILANFNMTYLEKKLEVNRKYISVYFKNEKQTNLTNYTNSLRIKLAENRLNNPADNYRKYTMEEMALQVGYKTSLTFKKYFTQYSNIPLKAEKKDS